MRVSFSLDDLALTRFGEAPAPLCEAFGGLLQLRNRPASAEAARWAARARRAFPVTARPLLDLIPASPPWPGFLDPPLPELDDALEVVRATPRATLREEVTLSWRGTARPPSWLRALADGEPEAIEIVVRALRDFYLACVAPGWPQIVARFHADIAGRVPVLATGGLAEVLGTLHGDLTWRDNGLERRWRPTQFSLDGTGVKLYPSTLWTGPPLFASQPPEWGGTSLIYPARSAQAAVEAGQSGDLAGLLGHTRTAVLQALRTPLGTGELAARAGTSPSSASEHASALRAAGLVRTVRRGRGVSHSLTPLGRSLLTRNFGSEPGRAGRRTEG
jgi:DNA-binding transcriptional ArsR family regulator